MTVKTIAIEKCGTDTRLLIDGGQAGLYPKESTAKAAARRFIHSTERLRWNPDGTASVGRKNAG